MSESLPDLRPQNERVLEYFSGPQRDFRYLSLVNFADRQLKSMHWCLSLADSAMPGGAQAKDLVHETFSSLQCAPGTPGHRVLPPRVAVEAALKEIIRSKASHLADGFENKHREDHMGLNRDGETVDLLDTDAEFWDSSQTKLSAQQLAHAAARCTEFIEFSRKDKQVCDMLMIIRDLSIDDTPRLAKELGIPVAQVYVVRRRLGTLVRQFRQAKTS